MEKKKVYRRMTMSVKCMVFHKGKLLILQKIDKEGLRPWEFPGGGLEFGEDFAVAAHREVKEETGLDVEILDVAGLWSFARSKSQFLTGIIFIGESESDEVALSHEHADFAWVYPEELEDYPLQDSLKAALARIQSRSEVGENLRKYFCEHYGSKYDAR